MSSKLAKTADFVILSAAKNPKNLRYALFMDTSLALSMTNSGFCLKITDIFTQILGTKFTNFTRFYGLPRSLCSLAMTDKENALCYFTRTADFVILSLLQKGEKSKGLKAHLLFLDTSLTLSMTNSGFCLKITDIFTQILKQKFTKFISYTHILKQNFKFFTQNSKHFINSTHFVNSKHFINSTHFITLSQISSPTQGFFIFLPQVFAQCKLIKNFLQGGHCV